MQAQWAKASNYFPTRASVADEMTDYFEANPAYATAFDLLPYGTFEPPVPGYDFVRDESEAVMAGIVDDPTLDVATALSSLNEVANGILSEQMSQIEPPTEE
jgi:ABC-type glycerol-3-phosphate transport system substrate-binding protein